MNQIELAKELLLSSFNRLDKQHQLCRNKSWWQDKKDLLIAEDNQDLQGLFQAGFKALYNITMVSSLVELSEKLKNNHYKVAILDEYLIDGKASQLLSDIKNCVDVVIFISAVNIDELKQKEGIIVLQKPEGLDKVYETLVQNV